MESGWLVDNGAQALGLHDCPDEEYNTRDRSYNRLQSEKVAAREYIVSMLGVVSTYETYILWIGNQIAGREINQNRKKHMKSFVVVPDDTGR